MSPRLVVRPRIHPRESLQQFIVRVSETNGFGHPARLLALAALPGSILSRRCDLTSLAALLAMDDPAALSDAAYWADESRDGLLAFGNSFVPTWAVNFSRSRICPSCVRETGTCSRLWDLGVVTACPAHGTPLVDGCACGRALSPLRSAIAACRCGRVIEVPEQAAPATLVAVAATLSQLADDRPPTGCAPVADLAAGLRLLRFAVAAKVRHPSSRHAATVSKPGTTEMAARLERSADVLLDWPSGLHELLAEHATVQVGQSGRVGLDAAFGTFIHRLKAVLSEPGLSLVADEVRKWLSRRVDAPAIKAWAFFSPCRVEHERLTAAGAGRILGISPDRVAALVDRGVLAGHVLPAGSRRVVLVEKTSAERICASRASLITAEAAAASLGIGVKQLHKLRLHSLLVEFGLIRDGRGTLYPPTFAADLDARLAALANGPGCTGSIDLGSLPRLRRVKLHDVLRSVLSGDIPLLHARATGDGVPVLARYSVPADATYKLGIRPEQPALGAARAARLLGVAPRMIPVLLAAGCLTSAEKLRGGRKRGVTLESIEAFKRKFTLARTVAREHGTSARRVAAELAIANVAPVIETNSGRGISAVWTVDAIAHIRPLLQRSVLVRRKAERPLRARRMPAVERHGDAPHGNDRP
ncbi:MAG: hypothetical protein EKK44_03790 [Methylobacterium sp.]|jgi:hypothetical protein|nr:MAG: hypothetical protein EKK44_03790 [Methylobacterium sp.]